MLKTSRWGSFHSSAPCYCYHWRTSQRSAKAHGSVEKNGGREMQPACWWPPNLTWGEPAPLRCGHNQLGASDEVAGRNKIWPELHCVKPTRT